MRNRLTVPTLAVLGLSVAAFAWAYGPMLYEFTANIWAYKPHYQHFPFVILASLVLMARELSSPTPGDAPGPYWAPAGFGLAWLLLFPAFLIPSPLLAVISMILLVGAVGCVVVRGSGQRFPLGSWALLWLIVPPPGPHRRPRDRGAAAAEQRLGQLRVGLVWRQPLDGRQRVGAARPDAVRR